MIIEKIAEYIGFKDISIYAFENKLGVSRGSISKAIKENKNIGSNVLENILIAYPDINPEWLLTGRGKMIIESTEIPEPVINEETTEHDSIESDGINIKEQAIKYLKEETEGFNIDRLFSYIFQKDEDNNSLHQTIAEQAKYIGQLEEKVFHLNETIKTLKK